MTAANPLAGGAGLAGLVLRVGGPSGVVGAFGWTRRTASGAPKFHRGIDLLAEAGAPVFCWLPGEVSHAGVLTGFGLCCYVAGTFQGEPALAIYAHLGRLEVGLGDVLAAGRRIGDVGRTGIDDPMIPTHLHLELRLRGVDRPSAVDPWFYLVATLAEPGLLENG